MNREKNVSLFSLRRGVTSYSGPLAELTVDGNPITLNDYNELTKLFNDSVTIICNTLYNQGSNPSSDLPDTITLSAEVVLKGNVFVIKDPNVVVTADNSIEQILGTGCVENSTDAVSWINNSLGSVGLGQECSINLGFDSNLIFEPWCNLNNVFSFVLKTSSDKEQISYRRERDSSGNQNRPELNTSSSVGSYFILNNKIIRVSESFEDLTNSITIGGENSYFSEFLVATRRMNISRTRSYLREVEDFFNLYANSSKFGIEGIVERSTNNEFSPITYWEGVNGVSPINSRGTLPSDVWRYGVSGTPEASIIQSPSNNDIVDLKNSETGQPARIRADWDNTTNPLNLNSNTDEGFTILTFINNKTDGVDSNRFIYFKDRCKLAIRDHKFRCVVNGSIDGAPERDRSLSGRFDIAENGWIGGGIVYSKKEKLLRVHTGSNDLVYQEDFEYIPDENDTRAFIGGDSSGNNIPEISVGAFLFLPYAIDANTVSQISNFWQKTYGQGSSEHELISGFDPLLQISEPRQFGFDVLRLIRQDVESYIELFLSADGAFELVNDNEVVSYFCPFSNQTYNFNANPPVLLEDDVTTGKKKLTIPRQLNDLPVTLSRLEGVDNNKLFTQITVRDTVDIEVKTFIKMTGSNGSSFELFRRQNDLNTSLQILPLDETTSFPDDPYNLSNEEPSGLLAVYNHPILRRSLLRFWSRCTSNYNTSGAIGRNRDWEERGLGRFVIENQRWARDCMIAGLLGLPKATNPATFDENGDLEISPEGNIQRAIRFIDWGWQFQILDQADPNYGGFNSGDNLHSSSFFLEAAGNIYQQLVEFGDQVLLDQVSDWLPKIELLALWLSDETIWNPIDRPEVFADTLEPFTHRFFLRGWGIWLAGHILDNSLLRESGEDFIQMGIDKQTEDGTNPERWAFDTSYQCVGCALLGMYYTLSNNTEFKSQIPTFIENAMESAITQMDLETGEVLFEGYRATTEVARAGGRKTFDMRFFAYASIFADSVLNFQKYTQIAAKVISYDERYHDLTTIAMNASGDNASIVVDGTNESQSIGYNNLGNTLDIELGDGVNSLEVFELLIMSADENDDLFANNRNLNAILKLPARKYNQPVSDEDENTPLFIQDQDLETN